MSNSPEETDNGFIGLKYLNIPMELVINKDINGTDMAMFALIDLLDNKDHCYASNQYFAEILGLSEIAISNSISKLIKHHYVKWISYDGRRR